MAVSYNNLWKLLIDKDMKKKDLQRVAGISAASVTKLGKNENVNTEIIQKICVALQCDVSDIMTHSTISAMTRKRISESFIFENTLFAVVFWLFIFSFLSAGCCRCRNSYCPAPASPISIAILYSSISASIASKLVIYSPFSSV